MVDLFTVGMLGRLNLTMPAANLLCDLGSAAPNTPIFPADIVCLVDGQQSPFSDVDLIKFSRHRQAHYRRFGRWH